MQVKTDLSSDNNDFKWCCWRKFDAYHVVLNNEHIDDMNDIVFPIKYSAQNSWLQMSYVRG